MYLECGLIALINVEGHVSNPFLLGRKQISLPIGRLNVAVRTRLELVTPCVTGRYSNLLN